MTSTNANARSATSGMIVYPYLFAVLTPISWVWVIPCFLMLDPITRDIIYVPSVIASSAASLAWLFIWRTRRAQGVDGAFAYLTARDLTGLTLAASLGHWFFALGDGRVPDFENFALLASQLGLGLVYSLTSYFSVRRELRQRTRPLDVTNLPSLRTITILNATTTCLMLACLLGVALLVRSSARLSEREAASLTPISNLVLAQISRSETPEQIDQIVEIWRQTGYLYVDAVTKGALPGWLSEGLQKAKTHYGWYALGADGRRWHIQIQERADRTIWFGLRAELKSSTATPEFAYALMFMVLLLFGVPLAAWLTSSEMTLALKEVIDGLTRIARIPSSSDLDSEARRDDLQPPELIPVPGNDELSDLAVQLNRKLALHDVSNRMLMRELSLASVSNRSQNRFLKTASGHLQKPLVDIQENCRLLADSVLSDAQMTDLTVIERAAQQLEEHITEILKLSELDLWRDLPLELDDFDLAELVKEVMNRHTELIKPNLTAEFAAADDIPLVRADRKRIAQVLTNLIENAFKYTDHGYVRVTAIKDQFPDGRAAAHIAVWDSGPGISVHDQEHIFKDFYRVASQRDQPGTGLGLAIAKRLVERHFGSIWVVSVENEGSTFHVRIPLQGAVGAVS